MGLGISKRFSKSHPLPRGSCKSRIEHPLGGSRSVRRNKGSSQGDLGLYVRFTTNQGNMPKTQANAADTCLESK